MSTFETNLGTQEAPAIGLNDAAKVILDLSDRLGADAAAVLTRKPATDLNRHAETYEARHSYLELCLGRVCTVRPPPVIRVIGDSHTLFFAGARDLRFFRYRGVGLIRRRYINRGLDLLPCFRTYHLGPTTAHNIAEPSSKNRGLQKLRLLAKDFPRSSHVMLSLGEIDCRYHLSRLVMAGAALETVARTTLTRMLRAVRVLLDAGHRVSIWGPSLIVADEVADASLVRGDYELRRKIIEIFAHLLTETCAPLGVQVACMAGTYHNPAMPPPIETYPDRLHLSPVLLPHAFKLLADKGILEL